MNATPDMKLSLQPVSGKRLDTEVNLRLIVSQAQAVDYRLDSLSAAEIGDELAGRASTLFTKMEQPEAEMNDDRRTYIRYTAVRLASLCLKVIERFPSLDADMELAEQAEFHANSARLAEVANG
jgi:hypothetical protein